MWRPGRQGTTWAGFSRNPGPTATGSSAAGSPRGRRDATTLVGPHRWRLALAFRLSSLRAGVLGGADHPERRAVDVREDLFSVRSLAGGDGEPGRSEGRHPSAG